MIVGSQPSSPAAVLEITGQVRHSRSEKSSILSSIVALTAMSLIDAVSAVCNQPATAPVRTMAPAQALQLLLDGNRRYVQARAAHPNQRPSDAPQKPLAVVLSCSDSRVPPEIVFDQGVGSLFVVRVAGNTYDRLALQTIEYAVGHLGTGLIMVIGHGQCGAVTAAVQTYPDPTAGPMLTNIYPAVREAVGRPDEISHAIDANAVLIAKQLENESALAKKIEEGELRIVPGRYILKTGEVKLLK